MDDEPQLYRAWQDNDGDWWVEVDGWWTCVTADVPPSPTLDALVAHWGHDRV